MMSENDSQEVETTEQAKQKLLELSTEKSKDVESFFRWFRTAIRGDNQFSYLTWLKDARFSPHVKLAIYIEQFNVVHYDAAQNFLDQAQTDRDMHDYLCNYLDENSHLPYRTMLNNFLGLMGRLMCFDYPTKTCEKILDIVQNPEKYSKYQVCCALDVFRYSYYRFDVTWLKKDEFYGNLERIWKKIVLETYDEDICVEGIYYVLKTGQLECTEYKDLVEKLLDKHPNDEVTVHIYTSYLKPHVMVSAFHHLKNIKDFQPNQQENILRGFCEAVASSDFLNSINFDANNELIQFCIATKETLWYLVQELNANYYKENYFNTIDMLLIIYLKLDSDAKVKLTCLNVMLKIINKKKYAGSKEAFEVYLKTVDDFVDKLKETFFSNSQDIVIKLRCVQALVILFCSIKKYNKTKKKLKETVLLMLVNEGKCNDENSVVSEILQYLYLTLLKRPISFEEIEELLERAKDAPELHERYLSIFYHVLTSLKCSEQELKSLISIMSLPTNNENPKLQVLTHMVLERLEEFCKRKHFKNTDLVFEHDKKNEFSILGPDYVFLKNLNTFEKISLEIVLYHIPKLNQIDPEEWKDNLNNDIFWHLGLSTISPVADITEVFKTSVNDFLSEQVCS